LDSPSGIVLDMPGERAMEDEIGPFAEPDLISDNIADLGRIRLVIKVETVRLEGGCLLRQGGNSLVESDAFALFDSQTTERCAIVDHVVPLLRDLAERHGRENIAFIVKGYIGDGGHIGHRPGEDFDKFRCATPEQHIWFALSDQVLKNHGCPFRFVP
jgi:hypothetical protein